MIRKICRRLRGRYGSLENERYIARLLGKFIRENRLLLEGYSFWGADGGPGVAGIVLYTTRTDVSPAAIAEKLVLFLRRKMGSRSAHTTDYPYPNCIAAEDVFAFADRIGIDRLKIV